MVNPENTGGVNEEKKVRGPNETLELHVNQKQNVPKAFSISEAHRSSEKLTIEEENARKEELKKIFQIKQSVTTVDPKVTEPYDPIPGRVPRKVAIDRKKKEYANFDIEQLRL